MGIPTLEALPGAIQAGDSLVLLIPLADFPADDGWTISYKLALPGGADAPLVIGPSTASGTQHALSVTPAVSAVWPSGLYSWQGQASKGSGGTLQVATFGTGAIHVFPVFAAGVDPRTHEEKCLAAITAVVEGRIGDPIAEYRIGDREAKRIPLFELLKLKSFYQSAVRRQRGETPFRLIPIEFQGRFGR